MGSSEPKKEQKVAKTICQSRSHEPHLSPCPSRWFLKRQSLSAVCVTGIPRSGQGIPKPLQMPPVANLIEEKACKGEVMEICVLWLAPLPHAPSWCPPALTALSPSPNAQSCYKFSSARCASSPTHIHSPERDQHLPGLKMNKHRLSPFSKLTP